MCDADAEAPSFYSDGWRKARKSHKCDVCGETIPKGHLYHFASGKWDGTVTTIKHCARCWRLYRHLCDLTDEPGAVDLRLDCGERYEGDDNDPAHLMAFMTLEEAQRYATRAKRRADQWGPMGLRDRIEGRAQYYAKYGNLVEQRQRRKARGY